MLTPSSHSATNADYTSCLRHHLDLWKGDIIELLREGHVIQHRLAASHGQLFDSKRIIRHFVKHMLPGMCPIGVGEVMR